MLRLVARGEAEQTRWGERQEPIKMLIRKYFASIQRPAERLENREHPTEPSGGKVRITQRLPYRCFGPEIVFARTLRMRRGTRRLH
jgi:hypothetical protein